MPRRTASDPRRRNFGRRDASPKRSTNERLASSGGPAPAPFRPTTKFLEVGPETVAAPAVLAEAGAASGDLRAVRAYFGRGLPAAAVGVAAGGATNGGWASAAALSSAAEEPPP